MSSYDKFNIYSAKHFDIAFNVLSANLARAQQQYQEAIFYWQTALSIEEELGGYDPPSWYLPNAQGLGFAYLTAKEPVAAKAAFEADLARHPKNGWSLYGLAQSYQMLGEKDKAQTTMQLFDKAWQHSDIALPIQSGSDIF